ncbi:CheY-like response regulator [Sphingobium yanoikuyae]|uniref:CheY-like response regulator n=2 Tax=Sphingobium yanoikuyae TaxID=13690 RepID=A0A084EEV9_SPHYA|nr:CheY-like response regulator [Sphingobium yanoikuyae]
MRSMVQSSHGCPLLAMPSVRSTQHDGRYTILVSDDDPGVRRGLQLLLRSRGYAVWGYTTGHALLADPRAKEADCVILDYRMPDIDGFAMLRHLREIGWSGRAIMIWPSRPEAAILVILENTSGTGWLLLTIAHARNDVPLR